jgi:chitinase
LPEILRPLIVLSLVVGLFGYVATARADDGAVTVSVGDITVGEGAGEVFLTISLDRATTSPVTVRYETSDGTARAGLDFVATSATTTVPAGHTSTTVTVPILDDSLDELNETFTVTLSDPSGRSFVSSDRFSIIIFDNDDPPSLTAGPGAQVVEGDGGAVVIVAVPVTLSAVSGLPVHVIYSTSDGTATVQDNDYTGVSYDHPV